MVSFFKWTFMVLLVGVAAYLWSFFSNLGADESSAIKKGAIEALNGESIDALTDPVAHLIRIDLASRRDQILEIMRLRAKKTVSDMLDGDSESPVEEPGDLH